MSLFESISMIIAVAVEPYQILTQVYLHTIMLSEKKPVHVTTNGLTVYFCNKKD